MQLVYRRVSSPMLMPLARPLADLSFLGTRCMRPMRLLALALLAGAVLATGEVTPAHGQTSGASVPPPQYSAVPVSNEQIDRAIGKLDSVVQDVLRTSKIPGLAVGVVRGGETVYAKGYGVRKEGDPTPVDEDTVFLLASLSKPIGATIVARQMTVARASWETPVIDLLPWFKLADPWISKKVTIGDLYAHRSGLPDHAGDDLEDLGYGRRVVLERLRYLPLANFRTDYAYTNFGLTAAAEAIATAAGQDWETLSETRLYEPLGMSSTSSRHADFLKRANRATPHIPGPNGFEPNELRQPDAQAPAGGVSSNVRDMTKWMALVLANGRHNGDEFISKDVLLPAVTPQVISSHPNAADARASTYGYGFGVGIQPSGRVTLSHSGAFALGAGTTFIMIPSLDVGIVVLTNASPIGAAEAIAATFADLMQFGEPTRDWFSTYNTAMAALMRPVGSLVGKQPPENRMPPRVLSAYVGQYKNRYFGQARVELRDGKVALLLGPTERAEVLEHWDGDDFVYKPFNENAPKGSLSRVSFRNFKSSRAGSVMIEVLNNNGLGEFSR